MKHLSSGFNAASHKGTQKATFTKSLNKELEGVESGDLGASYRATMT
jgi:hypothetical protein